MPTKSPTACVFCAIAQRTAPAVRIYEDELALAFLDRMPLFHGHVLVVPKAHVVTLPELPAAAVAPLFALVQRLSRVVPRALGAQGSFVALNNVVSQSVPHLHVHVVPRSKGDGLRGFFWPRQKYVDDAQMEAVGAKLRAAFA